MCERELSRGGRPWLQVRLEERSICPTDRPTVGLQKEAPGLGDDAIDGGIGELREHRQAEDFAGNRFAMAQPRRADRHAPAIGRMEMYRQRVVDAGADPRLAEMLAQPVALRGTDDILVENMRRAVAPRRQLERQVRQR